MIENAIFEASKKVYGLYGAFFKVVAQEIGIEKALELHANAHREQGLAAGKTLKNRFGEDSFDLEKLGSILKESNISFGIECVLDQSSDCFLFYKNFRCPLYDGYRAGGLDNQTAEALCQKGASAKLGNMLSYMNPNLVYNLKHYRSEPHEPCIEKIYMR